MDVGVWLRSLGLGQYEAAFRDSAIDVDVLADLTNGDLEKLGLPLGDRKRLLRVADSLCRSIRALSTIRDQSFSMSWKERHERVERRKPAFL